MLHLNHHVQYQVLVSKGDGEVPESAINISEARKKIKTNFGTKQNYELILTSHFPHGHKSIYSEVKCKMSLYREILKILKS
jgi:hypothetical protein